MAKTVVGAFEEFMGARNSLQELEGAGFSKDDISLIANDVDNRFNDTTQVDNSYSENAAFQSGTAANGTGTGDISNFVSGLKTADIAGIGQVAIAGPMASSTQQRGFIDQLESMGVPEDDSNFFAETVRRGDSMLVMQTDDDAAERAADIMRRNGAIDINRRFDYFRQSGFDRFDESATGYTSEQIASERGRYMQGQTGIESGEGISVPVVEEQTTVEKRPVQTDGVRVYNRVIEEPVDRNVTLRRENVTVDRQPADRPATQQDLQAFQEGEIDVLETSEEPVVTKQARVVEDVNINKNVTETNQPVHATVRRNDVDVQDIDSEDTLDEDENINRPITNRQGV